MRNWWKFLEESGVYLLADYLGYLRLLKEQKDGKWHEIHFQQIATDIWSIGYDKASKRLFAGGSSKILELTIPFNQINLLPQVILCKTTMPDGTKSVSGC